MTSGAATWALDHKQLWAAFQAKDWAQCEALSESQLAAVGIDPTTNSNYKNAVRFVICARAQLGQELGGPVLDALKRGLAALKMSHVRVCVITRAWLNNIRPRLAEDLEALVLPDPTAETSVAELSRAVDELSEKDLHLAMAPYTAKVVYGLLLRDRAAVDTRHTSDHKGQSSESPGVSKADAQGENEAIALSILDRFLQRAKPHGGHESGTLLALWLGLRGKKQAAEHAGTGAAPEHMLDVPVIVQGKSCFKIMTTSDQKEPTEMVLEWEEDELQRTIRTVLMEWELFGSGVALLTGNKLGFRPRLVWDLENVVAESNAPKVLPSDLAPSQNRCICQMNIQTPAMADALEALEAKHKGDDGWRIGLFHFLNRGGKDVPMLRQMQALPKDQVPKNAVVAIVNGGCHVRTQGRRGFWGRPAVIDEGPQHQTGRDQEHRLLFFWHELHHKYEDHFISSGDATAACGEMDFAIMSEKQHKHPYAYEHLWPEDFGDVATGPAKGVFPASWSVWSPSSSTATTKRTFSGGEMDWYVQCILRRMMTTVPEKRNADEKEQQQRQPVFVEQWLNGFGGLYERGNAKTDFQAEHKQLWAAFQAKDWAQCEALSESQLSEGCCKWHEKNYKNAVRFVICARSQLGQPVDGPVVAALRTGLKHLSLPESEAKQITAAWLDNVEKGLQAKVLAALTVTSSPK